MILPQHFGFLSLKQFCKLASNLVEFKFEFNFTRNLQTEIEFKFFVFDFPKSSSSSVIFTKFMLCLSSLCQVYDKFRKRVQVHEILYFEFKFEFEKKDQVLLIQVRSFGLKLSTTPPIFD